MPSCTYKKAERSSWYKLETDLLKKCGYLSGWPNTKWFTCDSLECTGPLTCTERDGCQLHCYDDVHNEAFTPRNFTGFENHLSELNGCENTMVLRFSGCTDHPCDYPSGKLRIVDKSNAKFTPPHTDLFAGHLNTLCDCKTCECDYCKVCDDCDDCGSCDERELICDCEVSWAEEFSKPITTKSTGISGSDSCGAKTSTMPTTKVDPTTPKTTNKPSKPTLKTPNPQQNTSPFKPEVQPPTVKSLPPPKTDDNGDDAAAVATTGGAALVGICVFMCLALCLLVFIVCKSRFRKDPPRRRGRPPATFNNIAYADGNFDVTLPTYDMAMASKAEEHHTGNTGFANNILPQHGHPGYSCPAYDEPSSPAYGLTTSPQYPIPPPYDPDGRGLNPSDHQTSGTDLSNTQSQNTEPISSFPSLETILSSPGTSV